MTDLPPILQVENLKKYFPTSGGLFGSSNEVRAVDGLSFSIARGETLSLVGESGCGKSTVGKAILQLVKPTGGTVRLNGQRIDDLSPGKMRLLRQDMQVVFQDPFSSLNPRMTVRDILAELPAIAEAITEGRFEIDAVAVPLAEVEQAWADAPLTDRRIVIVP